jgi:hypothetical protein
MASSRSIATVAGLLVVGAAGCRLLQSGPSDQEVVAAVQKVPPAPPTVGPTYMAEIESVQVQERGPYNVDGKYWPVRVRVKGAAKIRVTNVFQLGLQGDPSKQKTEPLEFVEEARFTKDDFGGWRVSYGYDLRPAWRLNEPRNP